MLSDQQYHNNQKFLHMIISFNIKDISPNNIKIIIISTRKVYKLNLQMNFVPFKPKLSHVMITVSPTGGGIHLRIGYRYLFLPFQLLHKTLFQNFSVPHNLIFALNQEYFEKVHFNIWKLGKSSVLTRKIWSNFSSEGLK